MAQLVAATELMIFVDHRLFAIVDHDCAEDETDPPATPGQVGHWLSTGVAAVYVDAQEDITEASLRLERWDGPAAFDESAWSRSDVVTVRMPSGRVGIDEIAAGGKGDVFTLPAPDDYRVRVAWLDLDVSDVNGDDSEELDIGSPEAFVLAQYWPLASF